MNGFEISTASDIRLGSTTVSAVYYGSTKLWPLAHDYSKDYLTFEALETGTFSFSTNAIQYSLDNGSMWTTLAAGASTPPINTGDKILFKQTGLTPGGEYVGIGTFSSSGRFNAMGNIMSLVYGDNFVNQTTLNNYQFCLLFCGCSLVDASNLILPSTTLTSNCYNSMFDGCGSLIAAPELPATTLAGRCYEKMFIGCISLTIAPELPATTLSGMCYKSMFDNCSSLTTAPELPATTLSNYCYEMMFMNCTSLNSVKCLATNISASGSRTNWLYNVAASGTFIKASTMTSWPIGDNGIPSGWTIQNEAHDYSQDYLTFEALEAGTTFTWTDTQNNNSISYSIDDGSTWSTLTSGSSTPTIAANNKVLFKASGLTVSSSYGIGTFSSSGRFNAMGNIMSLVYGDNFANQTTINNNYQFYKLFKSSKMIDASNLILPATTLSASCYREMFDSSELKITPKSLPATTLAENCYRSMFGNCASLRTVMSILPAMTLANSCYRYMFGNCYTFGTVMSILPATTLAQDCYRDMFKNCWNLTAAPELPATTLANSCYYNMFYGCDSLTTAPKLPATTLANSCYYSMFSGCTSLTTAPKLPATTLANSCYNQMFYGCGALNNVTCLASTYISGTTTSWMNAVSSTGTFTKAASATNWPRNISGIPSGWTVQDAS